MEELVERVLEHEAEATPPGEVEDVSVAVVGVGERGTGRLTGIGRRLGAEAFVGQTPSGVDAFGVDLPGETAAPGWEPTGRHVVERLERADRGADVRLSPEETDRLRRFVGSELDGYDTVVLAVDGTDRAAVPVASNVAAAFRGGPHGPTFVVPTFPAGDPPERLLAAEHGWLPDTRDRFGPDAVVPVEHGRATELGAVGSGGVPTAEDTDRPAVERVAESVTAALAEALGTRTMFGTLAGDLHHLRGRAVVHVGRRAHPDDLVDAEALVADALATPLAGTPADWEDGGAWLSHLRTPCVRDADIEAVPVRVGEALAERTGVAPGDRPVDRGSYRMTGTDPNELFLFRFERPDDGGEPGAVLGPDDDGRLCREDRRPVAEYDDPAAFTFEEPEDGDDEVDRGLDVVR